MCARPLLLFFNFVLMYSLMTLMYVFTGDAFILFVCFRSALTPVYFCGGGGGVLYFVASQVKKLFFVNLSHTTYFSL